MQGLSSDFKQFFLVKNNLLTSVHNDTDATDNADAADYYNRVIGIALLKAFSCANNVTHFNSPIIAIITPHCLVLQTVEKVEKLKKRSGGGIQGGV